MKKKIIPLLLIIAIILETVILYNQNIELKGKNSNITRQLEDSGILIDGEIYYFNKYKCLVIGGAYSVDKYWRLENNWIWFKNEQVPIEDRIKIFAETRGMDFDFVLSHTCPYSWMPTDKFLSFIDQSKVDNSMEFWLEEIKNNLGRIGVWLFAHYHVDRIERPYVEVIYHNIEDLDAIRERWGNYTRTKELPWWLEKSPNFYQEVNKENAKN